LGGSCSRRHGPSRRWAGPPNSSWGAHSPPRAGPTSIFPRCPSASSSPRWQASAKRSDSLLSAGSLVIPVTLGQLVSRRPDLSRVSLRNAEIALLIDERGQASWDFPEARPAQAMSITLEQVSFRYFDARNGQALKLSNVDGLLRIAADGGVSFRGSAVINSQVTRIDLSLKSLPRVNADGSPLELAIESNAASANFSGRLATAKVLSLAGPLSLTSPAPDVMARWAGLPLAEGMKLPGPLHLNGALDSAGRAYAIRNAVVTFGQFRAGGDVVADLRGERPRLQANLEAETVWLDALVPAAGAEAGTLGPRHPAASGAQGHGCGGEHPRAQRGLSRFRGGGIALRGDGEGREARSLRRLPPRQWRNGELHGTGRFGRAAARGRLQPQGGECRSRTSHRRSHRNQGAHRHGQSHAAAQRAGADAGTAGRHASGHGQPCAHRRPAFRTRSGRRGQRGARENSGRLERRARRHAIQSLTASVNLSDGLATIESAQLATPALQMSLTGTVDLLRRALDIKAMLPETAPLPVPVVVQGNWAAPRIYPDIPDILNNPEGGFARLRPIESLPAN
jgi:hypothetical protein